VDVVSLVRRERVSELACVVDKPNPSGHWTPRTSFLRFGITDWKTNISEASKKHRFCLQGVVWLRHNDEIINVSQRDRFPAKLLCQSRRNCCREFTAVMRTGRMTKR